MLQTFTSKDSIEVAKVSNRWCPYVDDKFYFTTQFQTYTLTHMHWVSRCQAIRNTFCINSFAIEILAFIIHELKRGTNMSYRKKKKEFLLFSVLILITNVICYVKINSLSENIENSCVCPSQVSCFDLSLLSYSYYIITNLIQNQVKFIARKRSLMN